MNIALIKFYHWHDLSISSCAGIMYDRHEGYKLFRGGPPHGRQSSISGPNRRIQSLTTQYSRVHPIFNFNLPITRKRETLPLGILWINTV